MNLYFTLDLITINICFKAYDKSGNITRTSEGVITLCRSCELFLNRDISRICRTSEISPPKTMNVSSTDDHHDCVLGFYACTTIDLILILVVYVYHFKEFIGVVIHSKRGS